MVFLNCDIDTAMKTQFFEKYKRDSCLQKLHQLQFGQQGHLKFTISEDKEYCVFIIVRIDVKIEELP